MVVLYMSVWGGSLVRDWNARQNWLRSATQVSRFTQAVKSYTGRYYDTLLSTAPVTVTPAATGSGDTQRNRREVLFSPAEPGVLQPGGRSDCVAYNFTVSFT